MDIYHNIPEGEIIVYLDGLKTINKSMVENNP